MLRWHREECPGPQVQLHKKSVDCVACGASYSHQYDSHMRYYEAPTPTPEGRSCLNLAWPSCVKYAKECIVKPTGESLSDVLSDYLGTAPQNTQAIAPHDEKSKLGFPGLPSDYHIRVLQLSPARQQNEPLHGYLEVQDLNGRHFYEALSYTWLDENDDAALSRKLYIGAGWDVLPITRSCSRALRRLRLECAHRPLWVDSICINQLNNIEKSHQIALMRTIYARSIRCVVDLGEPSSSSDIAIEYANNSVNDESMDQQSRQLVDDAFSEMFRRKYFSRIWIIQEMASAPHVNVNCGTHSTDWRLLIASAPIQTTPNWMHNFKGGIATQSPTSVYYGPDGLLQLLRDTVDSRSSDPRDKIFALLGLVRGLDPEGITADYDLTYVQVYTGLAAYFIKDHGFTKLITMKPHEDTSLPSWVPNWAAIREHDWNYLDLQRPPNFTLKDSLFETTLLVLDNSLKSVRFWGDIEYERIRSITQIPSSISEQLYRPEIHGQTGALTHAASCVFSFEDPAARKMSSTVYTKSLWKASERDISELIIVTLKPVIENTDIITFFLGQKKYTHLRRTLSSTYRILGEARFFLHELSEKLTVAIPNENGTEDSTLLEDYITLWYNKVSYASGLWEIFTDPTGIDGLQTKSLRKWRTCKFYYRIITVKDAHEEYLCFKQQIGSLHGVLRCWISSDAVPSAVADVIKCILYWREPQHWENMEISLLPFPREVAYFHLTAWVNANIIWQRWAAIEKLLVERHEMDKNCGISLRKRSTGAERLSIAQKPVKKIIGIWKDFTDNLVLRLNLLADAIDSEPFPTVGEPHTQATQFDRECDEFLDNTFAYILQELEATYRSRQPRQPAAGNDQLSSSLTESPKIPESDRGSYIPSGLDRGDLQDDATCTQCRICIDLRTRNDSISWQEHWKIPKSRSDIRAAVRALGVTTYGDRRRLALWRKPDIEARRAAQVIGSLLDLSIRNLAYEDMVII